MTKRLHGKLYSGSELLRIPDPLESMRSYMRPLGVGDRCKLTCGGPVLMVVDVLDTWITIAWKDGERTLEATLPAACFRRV